MITMRYVLLLWAILFAAACAAQAPEQMNYQAVVRDGADALVTNAPVGMRLSILQGSASGTVVFAETHISVTNSNGLASVALGAGTVLSGSMDNIDWNAGPFFLKTETDPNGGSNYGVVGTSPLLSVPYALYAKGSGSSLPGPPGPPGMPGVGACDPNDRDSLIVLNNNSMAWGFFQDANGAGQWIIHALGGTNQSSIASRKAVILYDQSQAHAFYLDNSGNGQWSVQALGGTNHTALATSKSAVLYNNSNAYAFHVDGGGVGVWTIQPMGGTNHDHVAYGGKIIVYNSSMAYSFVVDEANNGAWTSQALGGTATSVSTTP